MRPWTPLDARTALAVAQDSPEWRGWGPVQQQAFQARLAWYLTYPAWVAWHQDRPLCCGGVVRIWPGVGEAWVLVGSAAGQAPRAVLQACRVICEESVRCLPLHRLQSLVRADRPTWRLFARLVGFREEATLARYGPDGADYVLLVWS